MKRKGARNIFGNSKGFFQCLIILLFISTKEVERRKIGREGGVDTCPWLEARLTLTDIVSSGWRDTVETRPRLIVLNGFESVLTDAFSLFNLSCDPREKLRDTRV